MPVSTTEEEITSTSSQHALSMKTKSFAWRAWPSRIWSRTTRRQRPSVMSDGASLSANWNTSPNGTDEPLSRLTAGIPLPRPVMHASMYSTPYPWTDVNGYVLNVVWFTTVTPMPLSKKKFTAPGQKLCIGCWLTTGVTAPNMCFNGFHSIVPPELDVYRMNRANGLFNQM